MAVTVKIPQFLEHLTNKIRSVEVNGSTVGECLKDLVKQFPEVKKELFDDKGEVIYYVDIYLNDESTYPETLTKPVKDGDEISIVLMLSGG